MAKIKYEHQTDGVYCKNKAGILCGMLGFFTDINARECYAFKEDVIIPEGEKTFKRCQQCIDEFGE